HPHSRPGRWRTYVPMDRLVERVRRIARGPLLVLASLWVETEDELSEVRRGSVRLARDADAAIVCAGGRGRKFARSGLPVAVSAIADLLVHGPRFLPSCTSRDVVRVAQGGARAFSDEVAAACVTSSGEPLTLWDGG